MSVPTTARTRGFQTPAQLWDRADHVWFPVERNQRRRYKCCLCGMVTDFPPVYPTPVAFRCTEFELPLTPEERLLCPREAVLTPSQTNTGPVPELKPPRS